MSHDIIFTAILTNFRLTCLKALSFTVARSLAKWQGNNSI